MTVFADVGVEYRTFSLLLDLWAVVGGRRSIVAECGALCLALPFGQTRGPQRALSIITILAAAIYLSALHEVLCPAPVISLLTSLEKMYSLF